MGQEQKVDKETERLIKEMADRLIKDEGSRKKAKKIGNKTIVKTDNLSVSTIAKRRVK